MSELVTWIGPLGNLMPMRVGPSGVTATRFQATTTDRTIGGGTSVQIGPLGARMFEWPLAWATPDEIANLVALQQGVYGSGPFWWYDPVAVERNMLHPSTATPGLDGIEGWIAGTSTTISTPTVGNLVVNGLSAHTSTMPVIPGRTYTGAAEATATSRVTLSWRDASFVEVGTEVGADGTGRRTVSGVAPAGAAGVRLVIELPVSGLATLSRMQLTETDAPIGWFPGVGVPQVAILPPEETYRSTRDVTSVDYSVTLQEVL